VIRLSGKITIGFSPSSRARSLRFDRLTVDRKSFAFHHNLMGFPKVTVGEIGGYALGGGFEMALMTDISMMGRDTRIGMPATRFLGSALASCTDHGRW
jgi:enoyl-CoA hydratase/carnithine racemase